MFVVAQSIILKFVLFKNLMRALTMYFLSYFSNFRKYMRAVDQKHNYQLERPKAPSWHTLDRTAAVRVHVWIL